MVKFLTAEEAVKLIDDGSRVAIMGAGNVVVPEIIYAALEKRFKKTGHPRNLTVLFSNGMGDGKETGLTHFAHQDLVKRLIGGHFEESRALVELIQQNKVEAYNFPLGIMAQSFRDAAAGRPRITSPIGLGTFVDPREEGSKLNDATKEDLVEVVELDGQEFLNYSVEQIDLAIIRGTTADEWGNITLEEEPLALEVLSMAQAARNSGGTVLAQVKRVTTGGSLDPQKVKVPGILVDVVVVDPEQPQILGEEAYNPGYNGEIKVVFHRQSHAGPLNERVLVARRAVLELRPRAIINLGFGIADEIPAVAVQEGIINEFYVTVEQGTIGGIPQKGRSMAAQLNPQAIIDEPYQFDFYHGGGLDIAFLSFGEMDQEGNVNTSKLGSRVIGCGGFIGISQYAKKVVFCGTFTGSGMCIKTEKGMLTIFGEGKYRKFKTRVDQITFSGKRAKKEKQEVLYVTERAVFRLTKDGVMLIEIAPGVDIDKDILSNMDFKPLISSQLKEMDSLIFQRGPLDIQRRWQDFGYEK